MQEVRLFYPNEWSFHMEEPGFNWFLFSKKIWDPKAKVYYLEISTNTRFYDEEKGLTLKPKEKPLKVLLSKKPPKGKQLSLMGMKGYAFESKKQCSFPVCERVAFSFLPNSLEPVSSCYSCPIIKFCRRVNSELRSKNQSFPSCQEINELLSKNKCTEVCQILYKLLKKEY